MTVYVYKYGGQAPKPFTSARPLPWFGRSRHVSTDPHRGPVAIESAIAEILVGPGIAVVHGRAVEFGCFLFQARRVHE